MPYLHFSALIIVVALTTAGQATAAVDPLAPGVIADIDLSKPFATRTPWRLTVTQGPATKDYGDIDAPGSLTLCLRRGPTGPCRPDAVTPPLRPEPAGYATWEPHYLLAAKVVYPPGPKAAPFLLIVTGSLLSGDSNQVVATQLVAYDASRDTFRRIYVKSTGHNNNEEIRFVTKGPLQGNVIEAEPQQHLPYGFWITVENLTPAGTYRQVLRYRSATHYNDGNPLAVIDSEMPNIERRLGLWKPGQPIPTPDQNGGKPCPKPVLRHTELWCE